ncbi:GlxA family transcriptional regulator [Pseudomonas sp.]|uniref:choline metabolism transcriptional regulator GbdR n=1 Tax=Pseudomonas sp. TaxID=306 RepID=UPI002631CD16|nr:GlxA family transcriptional regulator [Pseudomonas sp.]
MPYDTLKAAPLKTVGFLLLDQFTLMSLASAVEPLRMANQLAGQELYRWYTLSAEGVQVWASDGVPITPDASLEDAPPLDTVIVCGGIGIQHVVLREHITWLRAQARRSRQIGGVCTGSWVLAQAGLLDGFQCSVHWECLAALREAFPHVTVSARLFTLDRDRVTSSGGTAPLDMMLHLISRQHGQTLSTAISEMFLHERIRNEQDHQRIPLKHMLGTQQPKLQEIVTLMEDNLEEPIELDVLAKNMGFSRRQLERLFQKYLNCSPSRYYLKLRLIRARQLLKQTRISIIELSSVCGFVSTQHFSKCYRESFGIAPRDERLVAQPPQPMMVRPSAQVVAIPRPMSVLDQARDEPTFASVKVQEPGAPLRA